MGIILILLVIGLGVVYLVWEKKQKKNDHAFKGFLYRRQKMSSGTSDFRMRIRSSYDSLKSSVRSGFTQLTNFKGRTARSEFWWWMLFSACVNMGISFISIHLGAYILSSICAMVFVLPNFSMAIRRLHDTGRSGWWYAPVLVPSSIFLICGPYGYGVHDSGGSILYVIMLIGSVINLIWWCKPGDEDGNKYGPNPNAVSNSSSLRRISIREEDVNHGAMSSPKDGYDSDDDKPRYIKID